MKIENPLEVGEAVMGRLAAATIAHRDAQEVAQRCAKVWRELVLEAVDAGVPIKTVAEVAGVSSPRVHRIVYVESAR